MLNNSLYAIVWGNRNKQTRIRIRCVRYTKKEIFLIYYSLFAFRRDRVWNPHIFDNERVAEEARPYPYLRVELTTVITVFDMLIDLCLFSRARLNHSQNYLYERDGNLFTSRFVVLCQS